MKTFVSVLFVAACFAACTHGFPGARRDPFDSDESGESDEKKNVDTVLVLPSGAKNRFGVSAIGLPDMSDLDDSFEGFAPSWSFNPFRSNPLDGFLTSMEDVIKRFRDQVVGVLSRAPEQGGAAWGKIPEGANTTSTTKIIDGHVVTINETTYMEGGDENGVLIRIRIVDVKPQNDTILMTESAADAEVTTLRPNFGVTDVNNEERPTPSPTESAETLEDMNNEIPKNTEDVLTA